MTLVLTAPVTRDPVTGFALTQIIQIDQANKVFTGTVADIINDVTVSSARIEVRDGTCKGAQVAADGQSLEEVLISLPHGFTDLMDIVNKAIEQYLSDKGLLPPGTAA